MKLQTRLSLGNFFSGVALQIDQPFHIGNRAIIQEEEGVVVSITGRATTIRTIEGMLVQIPNGLMSEEVVKAIPRPGNSANRDRDQESLTSNFT